MEAELIERILSVLRSLADREYEISRHRVMELEKWWYTKKYSLDLDGEPG